MSDESPTYKQRSLRQEKVSIFSNDSLSTNSGKNNLWLYDDNIEPPKFKVGIDYTSECKSLHTTKVSLESSLKDYMMINRFLVDEVNDLEKSMAKIEDDESTSKNYLSDFDSDKIKKRVRRLDADIEKSYHCSIPDCLKIYGSRDALNFHMKRKHRQCLKEVKKENTQKNWDY